MKNVEMSLQMLCLCQIALRILAPEEKMRSCCRMDGGSRFGIRAPGDARQLDLIRNLGIPTGCNTRRTTFTERSQMLGRTIRGGISPRCSLCCRCLTQIVPIDSREPAGRWTGKVFSFVFIRFSKIVQGYRKRTQLSRYHCEYDAHML